VYNVKDNIVAIATVPGKSALNIIRCSGPDVLDLYKHITEINKSPAPNYAHLKTVYHNSTILDQLMLTYFKQPKSFTGQDMLELSVHGGLVIVRKVVSIIESFNFRQAMPGEFSYRAFINGKLDLIQAESISSIIESNNNLDIIYLLNNLKGGLSKKIEEISTKLKELIIYIEHELDFEEDEIDFIKIEKYIKAMKTLYKQSIDLLETSYLANESKSNIDISIVGKTNVGKSSLFNDLVGYNRSIVTKKEGTTTDTIEVELIIKDISVTLTDTAGIRKTKEIIEKEGISRTYEAMEKSDIILYVDNKDPLSESKKYADMMKNKQILFIQSKADIEKHITDNKIFKISSKNKYGIRRLLTSLSTMVRKHSDSFQNNNTYLINARQEKIIKSFSGNLLKTIEVSQKTKDMVIIVSHLRSCYENLTALSGYKEKSEIINNIFKGFCVGK
jgi:tRNA modification GTPase